VATSTRVSIGQIDKKNCAPKHPSVSCSSLGDSKSMQAELSCRDLVEVDPQGARCGAGCQDDNTVRPFPVTGPVAKTSTWEKVGLVIDRLEEFSVE
jgi:hypothetical protein